MKIPDRTRALAALSSVHARTLGVLPTSAEPDWGIFLGGLSNKTIRAVEYRLRCWLDWAEALEQPFPLGTAQSINVFVDHLHEVGLGDFSIRNLVLTLQKYLNFVEWPDPSAKLALTHAVRAHASDHSSRYDRPVRTTSFGWANVRRLLEVADQNDAVEVRTVALTLVFFESFAQADEVLGYCRQGHWFVAPPARSDVRFLKDGSALLKLATVRGREVYLSPLTAQWLRRYFKLQPECGSALFMSRHGPLAFLGWKKRVATLAGRAKLEASTCNLKALRVGAVRDLLSAGATLDDARRAGGWKHLNAVIRLMDAPGHAHPMRHLAKVQGRDLVKPASRRPPCPPPAMDDLFAAA